MHGFSWKRMSEAVSMDVKRSPNSLIICFRHDYVDNIEPVIELGTIFTQKWSVDQKLHRTRSSLFSSVWCLILVSILTMLRSCRLFPEHTQPAKGTRLKHTHTAKGIRCKCDMILLWFLSYFSWKSATLEIPYLILRWYSPQATLLERFALVNVKIWIAKIP